MSSTISKYLTSKVTGSKRKSSSTSSDQGASPTDTLPPNEKKKERKKQRTLSEHSECSDSSGVEMEELKASLDLINQKLELVCMKEDIQCLKDEIARNTETLTLRMDVLESNLFDLQQERDKLFGEVQQLKKDNTSLRSQLESNRRETKVLQSTANDMEQHGRQWNVRIHGIKEAQRPAEETVSHCIQKCVDVIQQKVGVAVRTADVEMAHRTGRPRTATGGEQTRPRPILLRFFSRQKKSEVLQNRRKLKQSGVSISEDLTVANYKLLKQASSHSATMSAWSSNGRIFAKLKNGKNVHLTVGVEIDKQIQSEMGP